MPKKTRYPAIPRSKGQGSDVRAITETAEILTGSRGDGMDRALTPRDWEEAGFKVSTRRVGGDVVTKILPPTSGNPTVEKPHKPQSFIVTGGHMHIILEWDTPTYQGHAYTEIWRSGLNDFGSAVRIQTERANIAGDTVGLAASYFYWIRHVNTNGVPGPLNDTAGTLGQTAINVTQLLDDLSDKISTSQLHADLNTRIDLIDTPTTGLVDKAVSLQNQIDGLVVATNIDIYFQAAAPTGTIADGSRWFDTDDDNHPYIYNNGAWQDARDQLITTVATNLSTETTNRINADNAQVSRLDALEATVDNPTTGVAANTTAISGLDTRIDTAEGSISAHASDISSLQTTVFDVNNGVGAHTTALQGLDTRVTDNEGDIAANATDITALETTVNHPSTGVAANAGAISSLDTRVDTAEGTISSHSQSITSLTSDVQAAQGTADGAAGAVSSLTTRVTDAEGDIDAHSQSLLTLSTTVGGYSSAIQTNAQSINGLEARYTVKVDVNGHVAGYGLAATSNNYDGQVHSTMLFSVDTFAVASPGATSMSFVIENGRVVMDGIFVKDGTLDNAKIANLAVDKLTGMNSSFVLSTIGIGNIGRAYITDTLESDNYISGTSGMHVNFNTGYMEAHSGYFRGDIEATSIKAGTAEIIETLMLQDQAVTIPESVYEVHTLPPLTNVLAKIYDLDIDSSGAPIQLSGVMNVRNSSGDDDVVWLEVRENGVTVYKIDEFHTESGGRWNPIPIAFEHTPGEKFATYEVWARCNENLNYPERRSLLGLEVKK